MIRTILASFALATAILLAGQPAKAAWLCGPELCTWVNHPVDAVPAFAAAWPAPIQPNCFWKRGFFGRWKYVCPKM